MRHVISRNACVRACLQSEKKMTAELMGPTAKPYAEDWLAKILLPNRETYLDWY